jgi:pimeloyl-ACP methyl ester carboxylesterase
MGAVRNGVRVMSEGFLAGTRSLLSPAGLRGAAVECVWMAAHVALYPLCVAQERVRDVQRLGVTDLSALQRGLLVGNIEAAGTPILLIHGMVDNRSIFTILRRGLRRRGFGRVLTSNYSPFIGDIPTAALALAQQIELICAETGYDRIHVVGHSMGGFIARYYIQCLGGDQRVHTLVTLGSPHAGTAQAWFLPHGLARQLRPGSDIVRALAEPAPGCRTRFVAFWSDLDQMIIPRAAARIEHEDLRVRNVFVRAVGHMSLPIDGRVVHEISATLAHLDEAGATVTEGVTLLPRGREAAALRRARRTITPVQAAVHHPSRGDQAIRHEAGS